MQTISLTSSSGAEEVVEETDNNSTSTSEDLEGLNSTFKEVDNTSSNNKDRSKTYSKTQMS